MQKDTVRWGVVGTGGISHQVNSDFSFVEEGHVTAVCSRQQTSADLFARRYGIPLRFTNMSEMLGSDIDAVYIGTPHVTHFELASEALRAGKHVLCEKPLGLNSSEVRTLSELASAAGVFLMEAMWMKFAPLYRKITEIVNDGALGDVRSLQASFGAAFPRDQSSRWRPGGSTLLDQGIYPVTLAHMLFGAPTSLQAVGTVRADGVDLRGHAMLGYGGDRVAQLGFSMVDWLDSSAMIGGSDAWLTIDKGFWYASALTLHHPRERGQRDDEIVQVEREGFGYVPMLREVSRAILNGKLEHPLHTHADVAAIYQTMDAIRGQLRDQNGSTPVSA
ncbi:Gfo/Idh/MocA family protein [Paenarthrobacter sp. NPDC089675]|uniref:Gfo/Idh/MocA family protein n=1 Tax=Paenarthrobacter sp. NPDC089675 TaxID=3364376 RepID=UPI0038225363